MTIPNTQQDKSFTVRFLPADIEIAAPAGGTLGAAASAASFPLALPCGGKGKCANCRVRVLEGDAAVTEADRSVFSPEELADGCRLACRLTITGDLVIEYHLGETQGKESFGTGAVEDPYVEIIETSLPETETGSLETTFTRIAESMQKEKQASLSALQDLGRLVKNRESSPISAAVSPDMFLSFSTNPDFYGFAVDIGTTTVAGALVNLKTGETGQAMTCWNSQSAFGGDVISRIQYGNDRPEGIRSLYDAIHTTIEGLLVEIEEKASIPPERVITGAISGNPTMMHLFLGIPPAGLARAPYVGITAGGINVTASEFRLPVNRSAEVFLLPLIASNVGSDIVADLVAARLDQKSDLTVMVDLGTNGEIVAGNSTLLCACSTAAGPAFEGATITNGMRARPGAIDKVSFDAQNGLAVHVLGDRKPVGICGSGLLDVLAVLLEAGAVDQTGRFLDPGELPPEAHPDIRKNLVLREGKVSFMLDGVAFTAADIREIQLAKGSIAAGIQTLLSTLDFKEEDVGEVLLAGSFGNFLNPESAQRIGLVPQAIRKITPFGNAAGRGTRRALLNRSDRDLAFELSRKTRYVELANNENWRIFFAEQMLFPETTTP